MPFLVPSMPLLIDAWLYNPASSRYAAPDGSGLPGNLTPGKRVFADPAPNPVKVGLYTVYSQPTELLTLSGSIVVTPTDTIPYVLCEIPSGSKLFYFLTSTDYIGRGFANQHLFSVCWRVAQAMVFTDITVQVPYPLPT
jgi:hypothetical protein